MMYTSGTNPEVKIMSHDELGVIAAAHKQDELRKRNQQDLIVVRKTPSSTGQVFIGSVRTNSIVGEVDVEILGGNVIVTVRRKDESHFGPISMVVV
jgi:hypothetical protein